jgi:peptide deformylase
MVMTIKKIVTVPEMVLRKKAHKVTDFGSDLQILIDDMVETMRDAPGVGLAAPQVNIPWRVIVVEFGDEENEETPQKLYTLVNPEIVRSSTEKVTGTEGCLSIPGFAGEVERMESVTVKGQNRRGQFVRIKAKGWLARIFQHELDHLDGILFTDRAEKVYKIEEEIGQAVPRG